ncbi:MAG: CDP-diacylglycerol--glycerol-3-phosphate 3-phosphatidyltransferase [Deltaproteobacteria bacterium]|nr:CDP-diacylglycerol--glycerol-3-phosphate 3-phosphatidyltransferase [Deltaproteobacteria bacterium]
MPNLPVNIPNVLTVLRILLTPLFIIFLLKQMYTNALVVFTLAGISDALDGLIARWFNQRTTLGAYLDPIADKILLSSAFISLAILKVIPSWLTVIVISRDILILLGIAIFSITDIKVKIKPTLVSKCTTVAQLGTVLYTLFGLDSAAAVFIGQCIFWITAALTTLSGLHYMFVGLNILQNNLGTSQNEK